MYFVVNRTKQQVVISDLNLELKPRQAVDLDMLFDNFKIRNSKDLANAIKKGIIDLRQETKKRNSESAMLDDETTVTEKIDTEKIRDEIRNEIKEHMGDIKDALATKPDQGELLDVLKELTSALQKGKLGQTVVKENTIIREQSGSGEQIEGDKSDLDPSVAELLHAKVMERISKGAESKVGGHKEEKREEKNVVEDRVSELDNLTG